MSASGKLHRSVGPTRERQLWAVRNRLDCLLMRNAAGRHLVKRALCRHSLRCPRRSAKGRKLTYETIRTSAALSAWLALADETATVRFSNWVSGSSSFSFYFVDEIVYPGHASLRSLVWRSKCAAACMCRNGSGEPRFPARFKLRSRHFRLHPRTSSGLDDPVRLGGGLLVHAVPPTWS